MKTRYFAALTLIGLTLLFAAGCGQKEIAESAADAPAPRGAAAPAVSTASTPTSLPGSPSGAALAEENAAGPFTVTLTTEPERPTEGETALTAVVTRGGQPVTDAHIQLNLSMPTMNMGGPEVEMKHAEGGRYTAKANLSMGGAWEAKVEVHQGDQTGTATCNFTALQK